MDVGCKSSDASLGCGEVKSGTWRKVMDYLQHCRAFVAASCLSQQYSDIWSQCFYVVRDFSSIQRFHTVSEYADLDAAAVYTIICPCYISLMSVITLGMNG